MYKRLPERTMVTSHVRLPSPVPAPTGRRGGLLDRLPGEARQGSSRHDHEWADRRVTEDERMRLLAALLVLGSLLVWILFLQG